MFRPNRFLPLGGAVGLALAVTVAIGHDALAADQTEAARQLRSVEDELATHQRKVDQLRRQSAELSTEVNALRRDLVAAARDLQEAEQRASTIEQSLIRLDRDEANKRDRLIAQRQNNIMVLAALERLARHPPEALIARPGTTDDLVRSAILLRSTAPRLQSAGASLRRDLVALAETRRQLRQEREKLATARDDMARERGHIADLLDRKAAVQAEAAERVSEEAAQVAKLARQAETLQQLIDGLRRQRPETPSETQSETPKPQPPQQAQQDSRQPDTAQADDAQQVAVRTPTPQSPTTPGKADTLVAPLGGSVPISKAKGKLWPPAAGVVMAHFGEKNNRGLHRKGIEIKTRDGAQVVAPYDGRVGYAGPFRQYGELLIIEHGDGYHSLVAGLRHLDVVVGQWLLSGEPVGIMGPSENGQSPLYLELRHNGQPVDPLPWLATRTIEVMK